MVGNFISGLMLLKIFRWLLHFISQCKDNTFNCLSLEKNDAQGR